MVEAVPGMPLRRLRKLRGRSAKELRGRITQVLHGYFDRVVGQGSYPAGDRLRAILDGPGPRRGGSLLADFRRQPRPFFESFADPSATTAAVRRVVGPDGIAETIGIADRISAGDFDLLGLKHVGFGSPPDWHRDPVHGVSISRAHWTRIPFLDPSRVGDHKVVWEVNRHQYFTILGRAYWLTGSERYATVFAAHLDDWLSNNPPGLGINWASSLEVSFRAISWIWALHFFRHSPALTEPLYDRVCGALFAHARHIERFLSTWFSPNTHLTGEALGLVYIGAAFPELRGAARWRQTGLRILSEQLQRQIREDGVYFEQASYYHRYTADFYTHLLLLCNAHSVDAPPLLREKLSGLCDHLMWLTRPDGRTPLIGDDDGGRLVMLDNRPRDDFRSTLATAGVLLQRPDLAAVAESLGEESVWLLGPRATTEFARIGSRLPSETSRGFEHSGFFVMRDGWTRDSGYALFDCGVHGVMNCGHAHADALSFELAAAGRVWLTDPGTFTYTTDPTERVRFRHSSSHTTLTVDGESSSVPSGPFSWSHVAQCRVSSWLTDPRVDFVDGKHDGFERLTAPATCRRTILFFKRGYWLVRDRVTSPAPHAITAHYQCALGVLARVEEPNHVVLTAADSPASLHIVACTVDGAGRFAVGAGWASRAYGVRDGIDTCAFQVDNADALDMVTLLIPTPAQRGVQVRHTVRGAHRRLDIHTSNGRDIVLIGPHDSRDDGTITSDASYAWVRRDATLKVHEFGLINGRLLTVAGDALVDLPAPGALVTGEPGTPGSIICTSNARRGA